MYVFLVIKICFKPMKCLPFKCNLGFLVDSLSIKKLFISKHFCPFPQFKMHPNDL